MSDDKIATIRPDVVVSEGKQTFLDNVADAFDEVTAQKSSEPVAIVFALVTINGAVRTGYHTLAPVEERNSLYVDRGIAALERDAHSWDA